MTNTDHDVLETYLELIRTFTSGETSASNFSLEYMGEFKHEEGGMPEETYQILQDLFFVCESYVDDPELREEVYMAKDEKELLNAAKEAAHRIEERLEREYTGGENSR